MCDNRLKDFEVLKVPLSGVNLVEASAGTGKTYSIAGLYIRFIVELGLNVSEILVVTFTNAATYELRDRIFSRMRLLYELLNGKGDTDDALFLYYLKSNNKDDYILRLKKAILSFDESAIFTIHGFCNKVLRENAFESRAPFNINLEGDLKKIINKIVDDYFRKHFISIESEVEREIIKYSNIVSKRSQNNDIFFDFLWNVKGFLDFLDDFVVSFDFEMAKRIYKEFKNGLLNIKKINIENIKRDIENKVRKNSVNKMLYNITNVFNNKKADYSYIIKNLEKLISKYKVTEDLLEFYEILNTFLKFDKLCDEYINYHKKRLLLYYMENVENIKLELGISSYDDLLKRLYNVLNSNYGENLKFILNKKFKVAMIDEAQDTDLLQFEIFRRLFIEENKDSCCYFIGDPKQSIYAFRGADIFAYIRMKDKIQNIFTLTVNYRSNKQLINSFNTIFDIKNPFIYKDIPYIPIKYPENRKEDVPFALINNREESFSIINGKDKGTVFFDIFFKIKELLEFGTFSNGNKIKENDIAILVRSNNDIKELNEFLSNKGLHVVSLLKSDVFDTKEAYLIKNIFLLIESPGNLNYLKQFLLSKLSDFDKEKAFNLHLYQDLVVEESRKWFEYREIFYKRGITAFFYTLIEKENILKNIARYPGAERAITNFYHIFEVIQENFFNKPPDIQSIINFFEFNKKDVQELRLESDDAAIYITTYHSSKGLEFPIVFVIWSENNKTNAFYYHDGNKIVVDPKGKNEKIKNEQEAEIIRLFYVALTRAKSMCYLYFFKKSGVIYSKFNFFERKEELYKNNIKLLIINEINKKDVIISRNDVYKYDLHLKRFKRYLNINRGVYSYSRMIMGYEKLDEFESDKVIDYFEKSSIFEFHSGAKAGLFFHEIMEYIDFQGDDLEWIDTIKPLFLKYGFDYNMWKDTILTCIRRVVSTPLNDNLMLSKIPNKDRLNELEFYFPLKKLKRDDLLNVFSNYNKFDVKHILENLNIGCVNGFMMGFIDLVFRFNNKFYIVDWKSNLIGKGKEFYTKEFIKNEMRRHLYFLQYYIYALALHKYLKLNLVNYNFDKHFGGVFYIFMRWVDNNKRGIFYDKIQYEIISKLENIFCD